MAIGASNLFANNLYRDLINPRVSGQKLTIITRSMVFVVIGLALLFGMLFPAALVTLQLLGVSGMVQIFPAIVISLFWKNQTKEANVTARPMRRPMIVASFVWFFQNRLMTMAGNICTMPETPRS